MKTISLLKLRILHTAKPQPPVFTFPTIVQLMMLSVYEHLSVVVNHSQKVDTYWHNVLYLLKSTKVCMLKYLNRIVQYLLLKENLM